MRSRTPKATLSQFSTSFPPEARNNKLTLPTSSVIHTRFGKCCHIEHASIHNLCSRTEVHHFNVTRKVLTSKELPVDLDPKSTYEKSPPNNSMSFCRTDKRVAPQEDQSFHKNCFLQDVLKRLSLMIFHPTRWITKLISWDIIGSYSVV